MRRSYFEQLLLFATQGRVDVFDVFAGDSIGEGLKSIAVNIRLRADDRTLTDAEVVPIRRAIAEAVVVATGGELRGAV